MNSPKRSGASGAATSRGHVARKRFGQNFLTDQGVIDAIVRAIDPQAGERLVEIGPGLGALTAPLITTMQRQACLPLHAVELDRDLAARLRKRYDANTLALHEGDALAFDFRTLADGIGPGKLRIAGNLPYNISSPLLFHLADVADVVGDQHFMLQKEVVERMVAAPGDSEFGRLSVMLQVRYHMELLFEVPPEAFDPPPKVTSAIVRMIPIPANQLPDYDLNRFASVVAQAFSQRRKMLRNTLRDYAAQLEQVGIVPTARAEEVAVATYVELARAIDAAQK